MTIPPNVTIEAIPRTSGAGGYPSTWTVYVASGNLPDGSEHVTGQCKSIDGARKAFARALKKASRPKHACERCGVDASADYYSADHCDALCRDLVLCLPCCDIANAEQARETAHASREMDRDEYRAEARDAYAAPAE